MFSKKFLEPEEESKKKKQVILTQQEFMDKEVRIKVPVKKIQKPNNTEEIMQRITKLELLIQDKTAKEQTKKENISYSEVLEKLQASNSEYAKRTCAKLFRQKGTSSSRNQSYINNILSDFFQALKEEDLL